jgi:hypothetical protein
LLSPFDLNPSERHSGLQSPIDLNPSDRHSGLQSPIDLNPFERHSGLQSPIDLRCSRSPSRSAPPSRTESSSASSRRVKRSARATRSDCLPHQADGLPHQADGLPHQAECLPHQAECLPHQVWRTGCHMISRHLEAIDHTWFEIRDKHWGSRDSFKKGHRARISGEIDVDASVLLQADEGNFPRSSEGAAEAEVERACRGPDAPLHTLTTAPWLACIRSRRRPGLPTGRVGELQAKERRWAGRVRACGARVRAGSD